MWLQIILQAPGGGLASMVVPFGLMFLVFWFLIIRPQKKEHDEHQKFLNGLKAGDDVVTAGGIFGSIAQVDDQVIILEIARNTKIRILKKHIQSTKDTVTEDASEKSENKEDK